MEHCDVLMIPRMEFEGNGCASPHCAITHTSGPNKRPASALKCPLARLPSRPAQQKARRAGLLKVVYGVADGTRTRDDRNHNPGLYQLSYSHRRIKDYSRSQSQGWVPRLGRGALITTL